MGKLKVLKASSVYTKALSKVYSEDMGISERSYAQQYQAVMAAGFAWADFWKNNLEKSGEFEVKEIVVNAELMQKRWAEENGAEYLEHNWVLDILSAQIHAYEPDVFFAHDYQWITSEFISSIKREVSSLKLVLGWNGLDIRDLEKFSEVDILFTCHSDTTDFFRRHGKITHTLNFGFEEGVLSRIEKREKLYPISFVGGLSPQNRGHFKRAEFLRKICASFDVHMRLQCSGLERLNLQAKNQLRSFKLKGLWDSLNTKKVFNYLLDRSSSPVFGYEMYQTLADSLITLNSHIDASGRFAGNLRLFEATGVGACLLTDWKENISDFFVPDEEIVTYKCSAEAIDKLSYLLEHKEVAERIGLAGQERTLKDYRFQKMVSSVGDIILANL